MLFLLTSQTLTPGRVTFQSLPLDKDSVGVIKDATRMPELRIQLMDAAGQLLLDEIVQLADEYAKNTPIIGTTENWAVVTPGFITIPGVAGKLLSTYDRFVVQHELAVDEAVLRQTTNLHVVFKSHSP